MWSPTRDGHIRLLRRTKQGFEDPNIFVYLTHNRRCHIPREYLQRFYAHWRHRHVTHRTSGHPYEFVSMDRVHG
jgi:hypothetical protein